MGPPPPRHRQPQPAASAIDRSARCCALSPSSSAPLLLAFGLVLPARLPRRRRATDDTDENRKHSGMERRLVIGDEHRITRRSSPRCACTPHARPLCQRTGGREHTEDHITSQGDEAAHTGRATPACDLPSDEEHEPTACACRCSVHRRWIRRCSQPDIALFTHRHHAPSSSHHSALFALYPVVCFTSGPLKFHRSTSIVSVLQPASASPPPSSSPPFSSWTAAPFRGSKCCAYLECCQPLRSVRHTSTREGDARMCAR